MSAREVLVHDAGSVAVIPREVPSVWIVIPVHNRRSLTQACLESLEQQSVSGHVLVVDDGSTDGTAEMLAERFPTVVILSGDGSLWWSGAVNLGIQYALDAGCEYVLTLNDDTTFASDMVESFLRVAEAYPDTVQGAVAVDRTTGAVKYGAIHQDWVAATARSLPPPPDAGSLQPSDYLCGRGLWIPRRVLEAVGIFRAEVLPQGLADYEFTQRARAGGFDLAVNHRARVLLTSESISSHGERRRSLKAYWQHLTGMTGAGNVPHFVRYAYLVAPRGLRTWYACVGAARRALGYWVKPSPGHRGSSS